MILDSKYILLKMNRRIFLKELNPHLMCVLCGGYYVDATTIIECVHSFCRSCIVKHLESSKYCPICEVMVHKSKPLMNIRQDKTLQDIVYKLVPGLFAREMRDRRQFYKERPHYVKPDDIESGGEVSEERKSYLCDDSITVALTYHGTDDNPWHFRCPTAVVILHLKKLILCKYGFQSSKVQVEVLLNGQILDDDLSLLDLSCLYPYRCKEILHFTYVILEVNEKPVTSDCPSEKQTNLNSNEEQKTEKCVAVVEKEVQLQITESGIMSVSEIDSRQTNHVITCSATPIPLTLTVPVVPVKNKPFDVLKETQGSKEGKEKQQKPSLALPERQETVVLKPEMKATERKRLSVSFEETPKVGKIKQKRPSMACQEAVVKIQKLSTERESTEVKKHLQSLESPKTSDKIDAAKQQNTIDDMKKAENSQKQNQEANDIKRDKGQAELKSFEENQVKRYNPEKVQKVVESVGPRGSSKIDVAPQKEKSPVQVNSDRNSTVSETTTALIQIGQSQPKLNKSKSSQLPWRQVIPKEKLRPKLLSDDLNKIDKSNKVRTVPRFLGNPASGVKPMYSNGLPCPPTPGRKHDPIIRIDPKTLKPIQKEEKKAPNTLLTSPFIPRDSKILLPDPKTQPYSKMDIPPGFHASLPPSISLLMKQQNHFRHLRSREEAKNCDSHQPQPSASAMQPAVPASTSAASDSPQSAACGKPN